MPAIHMTSHTSAEAGNARYRRRPEVLVRELDREAVLLDVASGVYFGLNETGFRVLELLDGDRTVEQVEEALADEFAVDRETLRCDVRAILEALVSEGLVERSSVTGLEELGSGARI
jgi:hypothetical protein